MRAETFRTGVTPRRSAVGARAATVVVLAAGLLAACGGGGNKAAPTTTTTAAGADVTTSSVLDNSSSTSAPAAAASGTGATTGNVSNTTVKKATTTTASKALKSNVAGKTTATTVGSLLSVGATTSTTASEPPQPGGTLKMLMFSEPANLDPGLISASAVSVGGAQLFAIFDQLAVEDPFTGGVSGQIADGITSSDAVTWTLKLRPNVKFSDGTLYDADAVKYNIDRINDPNTKAPNFATAQTIQSMTVVDATTLKL